jgi:phosphonate transport system ATP-binding protein
VSYHDITIAAIQIRNQVIIFDYDFKSAVGVMIELQNVSVSYGDAIALYPTTLKLHQGQFTVLLYASGSGKSTLLRCINSLHASQRGTTIVAGLGNLANSRELRMHRRQTGMVFQQHQLIGRLTALQNVSMGRMGYHTALRSLFPLPAKDQSICLQSLDRVGLLHKALSRVDALSGGQQQRIGIARALAHQPKLVLADEPVASLDPATAERVLSLLHRICKEDGISAVVSLHQVDLAQRYADRIIGLSHGRVIFDAAPQTLDQASYDTLYEQVPRSSLSVPQDAREERLIDTSFPMQLATVKD